MVRKAVTVRASVAADLRRRRLSCDEEEARSGPTTDERSRRGKNGAAAIVSLLRAVGWCWWRRFLF